MPFPSSGGSGGSGSGVVIARLATATNTSILVGLENGDTVDGVVVATGDVVLLTGQTIASENGLYTVSVSGLAARSSDMATASVGDGKLVFIKNGTSSGLTYQQITPSVIVGTTSQSWAVLDRGSVGEYGSLTVSNVSTTTAAVTTFTDLLGASVLLPSAGTWELSFVASAFLDATEDARVVWTDSLDVNVGNPVRVSNSNLAAQTTIVTAKAIVIASAAATYKVRIATNATPVQLPNPAGTVTYKKISGLTTSSGQSVDFLRASRIGLQSITAINQALIINTLNSGNIPLNTTTGQITLTAGKTYELVASVPAYAGTGTQRPIFAWYNVTAGVVIGSQQGSYSSFDTATNTAPVGTANAIITPSVTTIVEYRFIGGITGQSITTGDFGGGNNELFYVSVKQLGSSSIQTIDNVALFGENTGIVNASTFSTTLTNISGSSFTLPTAGTWEVTYNVFGSHPSIANGTIAIYDASNVLVPNSTGNIAAFGNGLVNVEVTNKVFIITTGAATYQLKGQTAAGTMTVYNTSTLGVNNSGNSKITWNKISGTLPSSGQTVDFVNATLTTSQTTNLTAGDHVKFDTVSSGNIAFDIASTYSSVNGAASIGRVTLSAGKTYKLSGQISAAINASGGLNTYQWFNATTGTALPGSSIGLLISPANSSLNIRGGISEAIFTPSSDTLVELRLLNAITTPIDGASGTSIFITQLGSSAVYAGAFPQTWTNYTPTITGTTTNPTKPTSSEVFASYMVQGKTLFLNFKYSASATAGGNSGAGTYGFSLPGGIVLDMTKLTVPDTITDVAGSGILGGSQIGTGFGRNSTASNSSGLSIMPLTSTSVCAYFEGGNRLIGASSLALTGASNAMITFCVQAPIV